MCIYIEYTSCLHILRYSVRVYVKTLAVINSKHTKSHPVIAKNNKLQSKPKKNKSDSYRFSTFIMCSPKQTSWLHEITIFHRTLKPIFVYCLINNAPGINSLECRQEQKIYKKNRKNSLLLTWHPHFPSYFAFSYRRLTSVRQ